MKAGPLLLYSAATVVTLAAASLCGCQQLGGGSERWSPAHWFTARSSANTTGSLAPSLPLEPISEAQKADVQLTMAQSLEQQGRLDEAIALYREAQRRDPQRADAYHRLAVLHDRKGEPEAAEGYFQQALERSPRSAEILCDLGYHYYLVREWPLAEANLRKALTYDPTLRRAHTNLGLLYARTGRLDAAVHAFRLAGCTDAQARSNVGLALLLENRLPEAEQQFQTALAANPELEPAQAGLEAIQMAAHHEDRPQPESTAVQTVEKLPATLPRR